MLTAKMIKDCAIAAGADLCGIASVERFQDAPKEMHPLTLFPEAKTVIVFANRILKGCYKGIQEGTDWSTYWIYGYGTGLYTSRSLARPSTACLRNMATKASPGSHTLDEAPFTGNSWPRASVALRDLAHGWCRLACLGELAGPGVPHPDHRGNALRLS